MYNIYIMVNTILNLFYSVNENQFNCNDNSAQKRLTYQLIRIIQSSSQVRVLRTTLTTVLSGTKPMGKINNDQALPQLTMVLNTVYKCSEECALKRRQRRVENII